MSEKMLLTREEKIKIKRSGQYPPHLSREILHLYQQRFPEKLIVDEN